MNYKYVFKFETYCWVRTDMGEPILHGPGATQIAICMDTVTCRVLKHGAPEGIYAWLTRQREAAKPFFKNPVVITLPPRFDVEEINRCVENGYYLKEKLQGAGWWPPEYDEIKDDDELF